MVFKDRLDAAARLAEALNPLRGRDPLILAIPRGAVPMGKLLAERLQGDLDVVLVHKLWAPGAPQCFLGTVNEVGDIYIDPGAPQCGITEDFLERERERLLEDFRTRRAYYGSPLGSARVEGRIVVVVDDGVVTGLTLAAALRGVRKRRPAHLIAAAGVASRAAMERLSSEADKLVVLESPKDEHFSISDFFGDFPPVTDEMVAKTLRRLKGAERRVDSKARDAFAEDEGR